jgi:hypothetical protein
MNTKASFTFNLEAIDTLKLCILVVFRYFIWSDYESFSKELIEAQLANLQKKNLEGENHK